MASSHQSLLKQLELEFCPSIDPGLFLSLSGGLTDPTDPQQVEDLRLTLTDLVQDTDSSYEFSSSRDDSSLTNTSSFTSISTPDQDALSFLCAAFPHIPRQGLRTALDASPTGDLWDAIASILTLEHNSELESRDLAISPEEALVQPQKKAKKKSSNKQNTKKIVVGDVRQQSQRKQPMPPTPPVDGGLDVWSKISSIATQLTSLLPTQPSSFFTSYFHNPIYETPYVALCAALARIHQLNPSKIDIDILKPTMLEILGNNYPISRSLVKEVDLALYATSGQELEALELIYLLRSLDDDSTQGQFSMGAYHSSSFSSPTSSKPSVIYSLDSPSSPAPSNAVSLRGYSTSHHRVKTQQKPDPYQWQHVPEKPPPKEYTHASFIPKKNVRGSGNQFGKGGKGDVGELGFGGGDNNRTLISSLQRRRDLLKRAADAWKSGNSTNHGGQIAFYYAEEARRAFHDVQQERLDASRDMVEKKRNRSGDVDLHGTSVNEAIIILEEILEKQPPTPDQPLRVITGRGIHSKNHKSVLKPALKTALSPKWDVRLGESELTIRGPR